MIPPRHFDQSEAEQRNLTPKRGKPRVAGDLSTLRFIRDEYLSLITTGSPARDDDSGRQHTVIRRGTNWPKQCPDRQTAACLDGVSFETLAVQHPRATLWPSPPRWEACHLILSRLRLPANQVPLPPQGGARFSGVFRSCHLQWSGGQRHNLLFPLEGKCRAAAKGCTRLRVEMKRKGGPDRQTAACLGECHFEALAVQHPRATSWPSPPQGGARGSGALCSHRLQWSRGTAAQSLVSP